MLKPEDITKITDVDMAFGTTQFLPPYDDDKRPDSWERLASELFFQGFVEDSWKNIVIREEFKPVEKSVGRFLRAHLASFEPKHQHKEQGVGILLSQIFEIKGKQ